MLVEDIEPDETLKKLHISLHDGSIIKDIEAFIVLWNHIPAFRVIAWLAIIAPINAAIKKAYGYFTLRRFAVVAGNVMSSVRSHNVLFI